MNTLLTAEDLEDLEEYRGLEGNRGGQWNVHLRWMLERQPDLCRELHKAGKLGLWCDRKDQQALLLEDKLVGEGMDREDAREVVLAQVRAPAEGLEDDPPNPLSEREQKEMEEAATWEE